eukprot:GHVQ01008449.1.p1 GENE.GHVQ01008449.1~~GHVQ01008449.1.p1  ORF type:complete len:104 (-),score=18.73 GHVQ01008449.1:210-488(-)
MTAAGSTTNPSLCCHPLSPHLWTPSVDLVSLSVRVSACVSEENQMSTDTPKFCVFLYSSELCMCLCVCLYSSELVCFHVRAVNYYDRQVLAS